MINNSAIILPLKESFSDKDFGAVSIWVDYYLKYTKKNNDYVFCRKLSNNYKYLNNKVIPVAVKSKFYTNLQYIKNISAEINKRNISIVEIHNRPEYAYYLIKNNPNLKINLIFHNDPNTIRNSNTSDYKKFLLDNCNKIVFVSNWVKKRFFFNLINKIIDNLNIILMFIIKIQKESFFNPITYKNNFITIF